MSRSLLIPVYAVLSLCALVATWTFNIAHVVHGGSFISFWSDGFVNDASSSLTNDILFATAVAFVFMVVDARRTGVRRVWIYMVLCLVIATSVVFPIYLIARERAINLAEGA